MTEDVSKLSMSEIARRTGRSPQAVKRLLDLGIMKGTILIAPKGTRFRKAPPRTPRKQMLAADLLITAKQLSGPMFEALLKALRIHHPDVAAWAEGAYRAQR